MGIVGEPPEHFFCEQCRACWADPYWEVKNSRVMPVSRLVPSGGPVIRGAGGGHEIEQVAERTFQLTHPQVELLKKAGVYQLQVRLMLQGAFVQIARAYAHTPTPTPQYCLLTCPSHQLDCLPTRQHLSEGQEPIPSAGWCQKIFHLFTSLHFKS